MTLPPHLLERRERVRDASEELRTGPQHTVGTTVARLRGSSAQLQWCSKAIEASVAALGVDTTYELLTRLQEVAGELARVDAAWSSFASAERERARQYEELYDALYSHCATLRGKQEAAERELRQVVAQRDAQDATLDEAVEHIHGVIAEHAAWQEQHGYNAQQLPVEEQRYADKCVAAMRSIYAVRQLQQQGTTTTQQQQQPQQQQQSPPLPTLTPVNTCTVSLVDDAASLAARWASAASARHCVTVPSARLRYTPPAQEVALLRRVLAMGTGSAALMADIDDKQTRYRASVARIRDALRRVRAGAQQARGDLQALRQYMQQLREGNLPFVASQDELLRLLQQYLARQQQEHQLQLQQAQARLGAAASAQVHTTATAWHRGGGGSNSNGNHHYHRSSHHGKNSHAQTSAHTDGDKSISNTAARVPDDVDGNADFDAPLHDCHSVTSLVQSGQRPSLELSGPTAGYLFPMESSTRYSFSMQSSASANNDTSSFM